MVYLHLVNDHPEGARPQPGDRFGDHRELLDRRDDDILRLFQELPELGRIPVHAVHHPFGLFQLGDGMLKLFIQHFAVGDHDDRVEDAVRIVLAAVERSEQVKEPGARSFR